jgi:CBS domain-containing protein
MPVDEATAFFTGSEPRRRSYPIVDGRGRLVGMAARAEVLRWVTEGPHKGQTLAEALSDPDVPTTHAEELVGALAERMVEADFGRAPVLDAQGRVIGLVTRKDLLRVHAQRREVEADRQAVFGRTLRPVQDPG